MPIEPANPYGWIVWLISIIVMGFNIAAGTVYITPSEDFARGVIRGDFGYSPSTGSHALGIALDIESIEIAQPEFGKTVLSVVGRQPANCAGGVQVNQLYREYTIWVSIFIDVRRDDVCLQRTKAYIQNIPLETQLSPGTYQFIVNGIILEAEIK